MTIEKGRTLCTFYEVCTLREIVGHSDEETKLEKLKAAKEMLYYFFGITGLLESLRNFLTWVD
jgi:hypothetical protein